jgi:hypothetical protein
VSLHIPPQDEAAKVLGNGKPVTKSVVGVVDNPDDYFAQQKVDIFHKLGDISTLRVLLNRIWIAVWIRPDFKDLGGGKKIFHTDNTRGEDVWQGNTGLVVKMGPLAFQNDESFDWHGETCEVGDWVLYHRGGYGMRFKHNGVDCLILEQEKAIKAVLSRPDLVE